MVKQGTCFDNNKNKKHVDLNRIVGLHKPKAWTWWESRCFRKRWQISPFHRDLWQGSLVFTGTISRKLIYKCKQDFEQISRDKNVSCVILQTEWVWLNRCSLWKLSPTLAVTATQHLLAVIGVWHERRLQIRDEATYWLRSNKISQLDCAYTDFSLKSKAKFNLFWMRSCTPCDTTLHVHLVTPPLEVGSGEPSANFDCPSWKRMCGSLSQSQPAFWNNSASFRYHVDSEILICTAESPHRTQILLRWLSILGVDAIELRHKVYKISTFT